MKSLDAVLRARASALALSLLPALAACSQDKGEPRKDGGTTTPTSGGATSSSGGATSSSGSTTSSSGGATSSSGSTTSSSGGATSTPSDGPAPPTMSDFCSLPGSIVFDDSGRHVVGGDTGQLPWLTLQKGFCAHHFAKLTSVREIRFGPKGELFASSPGRTCVGGAGIGLGAVVMIPDDDGDGLGDAPIQILSNLEAAHGFAFAPGVIYYQATVTQIRKAPYDGGRAPIANAASAGEAVADITVYQSDVHWTKTIDIADDGTVYVTNGGDNGSMCGATQPFQGGILKIDGSPGGHQVASGFRNPIRVRCQHGHNNCFALELARDGSGSIGGREKLVLVREGDDWGHPCCATKDLPFSDIGAGADCSKVASEDNAFVIGSTPFGLDFVPSSWPAPYAGGVVIALHGVFAQWQGAKVVAISADPVTGMPIKTSTTGSTPSGPISDLATGWDDGTRAHGRPTVATFGPDGRLYIGDDTANEIFWIAPVVSH